MVAQCNSTLRDVLRFLNSPLASAVVSHLLTMSTLICIFHTKGAFQSVRFHTKCAFPHEGCVLPIRGAFSAFII